MIKKTICGIYKIQSPSGKIYIGQSEDIYRRWKLYKGKYITSNRSYKRSYPQHLHHSIKKYGWEAHSFDIVEECAPDKLNEREMYWICFFNSYKSRHGMNCTKGGDGVKGYKWSEDARKRQSESHKGIKPWNTGKTLPPEMVENNSRAQIKRWQIAKADPNYYSEEQVNKRKNGHLTDWSAVRKAMWGRIKSSKSFHSKENIQKRSMTAVLREKNKRDSGFKKSEETLMKHSEASKKMWSHKKSTGVPYFSQQAVQNMREANSNGRGMSSKQSIQKMADSLKKLILNTQTGIYYLGIREAAASNGISYSTLAKKLIGNLANNTYFIYV